MKKLLSFREILLETTYHDDAWFKHIGSTMSIPDKMSDDLGSQHDRLTDWHSPPHHLTDSASNALLHYTGWSYDTNQFLLKKHQGNYKEPSTEAPELNDPDFNNWAHSRSAYNHLTEMVNGVHEYIKTCAQPLTEDVHAYSGTKGYDPSAHGQYFHTPAFTSTSIDPRTALNFSGRHQAGDTKHIIHFHLPAGYTRGAYLGDMSENPLEREFLLDKGQTWKLTGKSEGWVDASGYPYTEGKKLVIHHAVPVKLTNEAFEHDDTDGRHWQTDDFTPTEPRERAGKDVSLAHNLLSAHHARDQVSPREHFAIQDHTRSSYDINSQLVKGGDLGRNEKERVGFLESAIEKSPALPQTTHVYSAISFNPRHLADMGGVFHSPAFLSTSIDPHIASTTANVKNLTVDSDHPNKGVDHVLHFELPAGYKGGRYIAHHSGFPREKEFLLNRNQRFKITGMTSEQVSRISHGNTVVRERRMYHVVPLDHLNEEVISEIAFSIKPFKRLVHIKKISNMYDPDPKYQPYQKDWEQRKKQAASDASIEHRLLRSHPDHQLGKDPNVDTAFRWYEGSGSHTMNFHLLGRKQYEDTMLSYGGLSKEEAIEHIKGAISREPSLPHQMEVYSGLSNFNPKNHADANGGVFETKAFTSTSFNPYITHFFVDRHAPAGTHELIKHGHILHFTLPKGYNKGIAIGDSDPGSEHEYVLAPNQKWKITGESRGWSTKYRIPFSSSNDEITKQRKHLHIWHVVPADDEDVHEATYHDPNVFRSYNPGGTGIKHSARMNAASNKVHAARFAASEDSSTQSELFSKHQLAKLPYTHRSAQQDRYDESHREAIGQYTSDNSFAINMAAISQHSKPGYPMDPAEDDIHAAKFLKSVIHERGFALPHETHVYSGISPNFASVVKHSFGGNRIIHSPAFVSTSLNPTLSEDFGASEHHFLHDRYSPPVKHVLHFILPKGYKNGIYADPYSEHAEKEYLLNANQYFKIIGHKTLPKYGMSYDLADNGERVNARLHKLQKTKVWTLVPHEPELNEAYEHPDELVQTHFLDRSKRFYNDADEVKIARHYSDVDNVHNDLMLAHPTKDKKTDKAINYYTGAGSKFINKDLIRHNRVTNQFGIDYEVGPDFASLGRETHHNNLMEAISKAAPLHKTLHVYSALRKTDPNVLFKNASEDGVVHFPAYTSTSISLRGIQDHLTTAQSNRGEYHRHVLHFELPEGYDKGIYVAGSSQYPREKEFLLAPNQHFKLHDHEVRTTHDEYNWGGKPFHLHIWHLKPHNN